MIQKLDDEKIKDCKPFTMHVDKGDTIVIQFDQDIFDIDEAQQLLKVFQSNFPENDIIATFKGQEIKGVIKDEYCTKRNKTF